VRNDLHLLFGPFRLDPLNAQLWRGSQEIALRPKTFEVLRHLVDRPGQLVTKAALLDAVWAEVAVSDSMPAVCVKELRKALGDGARTPKFIETIHRRGYRFIAEVTTAEAKKASSLPSAKTPRTPAAIMVGRDLELEKLRHWYSQTLEGHRRVIFVSGEAGIGKSTFVNSFMDSIAEEKAACIARGQCIEQFGAGEPYMPLLESLSRLGGERGGERVVDALRKFAPTWLAQMPSLLDKGEHLSAVTQGITQQRMLREMTQALEAIAEESALVLMIEDLHWSDFSTLELISAIARRNDPARLLVIGTYRPFENLPHDHPLRAMKEELELHRYCEELRLNLLNQQHVTRYLAGRFPGIDLQRLQAFAHMIHQRTDGNPLFMINVVDYLANAGWFSLSGATGESSALLPLDRIDPPRSIRQMIERNLARLQPDEQAVLEGASVAGAEFSAALVAAALDRSQNEVEDCCARLSRHEQFVSSQGSVAWPDGTIAANFRFHHSLYQEVLYSRLPIGHRLQLHRRIALREEAGYGEQASEVAGELAHHYSMANVKNKAIQYFQLAGERASARGAMVEAEEQYRCALNLLGELPQTSERDRRELELQLSVGSALVVTKGWTAPETGRAYSSARELCDRLGDSPELFPALFGIYAMYLVRGDIRNANALAQQLMRQTDDVKNSALTLYAHIAMGVTSYFMGEFGSALEHLETGVSIYEPERHRSLILRYGFDPGVWCLCYAAATLWQLGYPDRARKRNNEALALAEKLSHPLNLAQAELWAGIMHQFRGDARIVLETTDRLIARATEHGITDWLHWASCLRGWAKAALGDGEVGIREIRESRAALEAKGAGVWRPYFLSLLADAYLRMNSIGDGLRAITDALIAADKYDEREHEPYIHWLNGECLLRGNDLVAGEARRCFEQAIDLARKRDARSLELRATMSLARLLAKQGDSDTGRAMLAKIYAWFSEGFDTFDLAQAKALLNELGSEVGTPKALRDSRRTGQS
jgi:DNA-binding winged helix-turn-helix (wHTH) protein/predicted ATPase